jgi:GMP synthase (glutamine-hydrolysing)
MDELNTLLIIKLGSTYPWLAKELGDFENWVVEGMKCVDEKTEIISPPLGQPLPSLEGVAGIVLTGSHSMVSDREAWSEKTAAWILEVLDREIPLLGICYGHQLMAHAAGGLVGYNAKGTEFGTTEVYLHEEADSDPIFRELPSPMRAHVCHAQSVLRLPETALVLASNAHDPHQAFRIGKYAWGVQFHPEFSLRAIKGYLEHSSEELRSEGRDLEKLLHAVGDTPEAGSILSRFRTFAREHAGSR